MILSEVNAACRKSILQGYRCFNAIPTDVDWKQFTDEQKIFLLQCSEGMRESLRSLSMDVNTIAESGDGESARNSGCTETDIDYSQLLDKVFDTTYCLEKSWHVCEIFMLNPTPLLSIDFASWLKEISYAYPLEVHVQHFQQDFAMPEREQVERMDLASENDQGTSNGGLWSYWDLVYQLVLQGSLQAAGDMLQLHSEIALGLLQERSTGPRTRSSTDSMGSFHIHGDSSGITRAQCLALLEVIYGHPYAAMVTSSGATPGAAGGDQGGAADPSGLPTKGSIAKIISEKGASGAAQLATRMSAEFTAWQQRVQRLRDSSRSMELFRVVPELDAVLLLLLGDTSILQQVGARRWGQQTIAHLLYVHPPPLSRADLCRITEGCIRSCEASDGSGGDGDGDYRDIVAQGAGSTDKLYMRTMREVMAGNMGPVLRSMYELSYACANIIKDCRISYHSAHSSGSNTSAADSGACSGMEQVLLPQQWSLVPLLSAAHLALLLVACGGQEDLLLPLQGPQQPHSGTNTAGDGQGQGEASFFEELFLELVERLHVLEYPIQVLVRYLSVCPLRGRDYARVLLPRQRIYSDADARAVAQALEQLGWPDESVSVLVRRGMWWLSHNPRPTNGTCAVLATAATTATAAGGLRELEFRRVHGSTLSKAAMFFQQAGDAVRLTAVVESSLCRCMRAVTNCQLLFPGLTLLPSCPAVAAATATATAATATAAATAPSSLQGQQQDRETVQRDQLLEFYAALTEAAELIHAVGGDLDDFDDAALALQPQLLHLKKCSSALSQYCAAVVTRFTTSSNDDDNDDDALGMGGQTRLEEAHGGASMAATQEVLARMVEAPSAREMRRGAVALAGLVTSHCDGHLPALSIKYWLHVLELTAWFHNTVITLDLKQQQQQQHTEVEGETAIDTQSQKAQDRVILSKDCTYKLLCALQQVLGSYCAAELVASALPAPVTSGAPDIDEAATGGEMDTGSSSNTRVRGSEGGPIQQLRLSLLGILARSTVSENRILGDRVCAAADEMAQASFDDNRMNGGSVYYRGSSSVGNRMNSSVSPRADGTATGGFANSGTRLQLPMSSSVTSLHIGAATSSSAAEVHAEEAAFELLTAGACAF